MPELPPDQKRARNIVLAIGFVVMLACAYLTNRAIVSAVRNSQAEKQLVEDEIDPELAKIAAEINKTTPMQLDRATRLDSCAAMPGMKLHYFYTLLEPQPAEVADWDLAKDKLRPAVIENYRSNQDMLTLRNKGVCLVYIYSSEQGDELFRFEVSAEDLAE